MTIDEIIERLQYIQERVLNARMQDVTESYFSGEQTELTSLLDMVRQLDGDERKTVMEAITTFSDKLKNKLVELKTEISSIEENMDDNQNRIRGIKAYSGKVFRS